MSEWKKVKLGDCITTKKGFAFKSALYTSKGVPVVRVSDFTLNSITDKDLVYYPVSEYDKYKDYVLAEKDILIQTVGSWQYNPNSVVGKVVRVPYYHQGSLLNQNIVKIIPIEGVDKNFLYYRIKCVDFSGFVIGEARGAANQASITLDTIKRFPFCLPPSKEQYNIGTILSRYDSLIENYQKQIKLLEEAAQRLYKEWFVDHHFPGHENTKIVDGMPKGWEKKMIGDIVKIRSGYAFKSKDWQSTGCPVVKIKDITGTFVNSGLLDCVTFDIASKAKHFLLNSGDLVIAMTGATIGKIGIIVDNGLYTNQRVGKFFINDGDLPFVYCFFKQESSQKQIIQLSSASSAQPNISGTQIESLSFVYNKELYNKYNLECISLFKQMISLQSQIRLLTEARDRLLPKLISGEIEV